MAKIETTTKKFKAGIRLSGSKDEIRWESTGHLVVRLLDELGQAPLAGRECKVEIPGEGLVTLTADDDGWIRHPDVPFQDYDLDLGEKVRVHAPAVANPGDGHERHVPGVRFGFVNLYIGDEDGPIVEVDIELEGPDGKQTLRTDRGGMARASGQLPSGEYTVRLGGRSVTTSLPDRERGIVIVTLPAEEDA